LLFAARVGRALGVVTLAVLQELEHDAVMGTYARNPVEFVRGQGTRLWDDEGNEYLDFLCGISVSLLGHCHPGVVEAITEQAERLIHVGNLFYAEPPMRLAARLAELAGGGKVFFTNSGAEAIECALKLARKRRQGGEFVVLERGFHGRTYGALSATPQEAKQAPFAPLVPGFHAVAPDDPDALVAAVSDRTAAVLVEAVQGEGGIHPLESGLLEAARAACDKHGAVLICDEIQCGLGRTGALWGFEHAGITPDVITLAKGLGGGLPVGACIAAPDVADVLAAGDHGSTFAGGPVGAAAANAVLDVVEDPGLLPEVRAKGERLRLGLEGLGLDVRGIGLMLAFRTADGPGLVRRALTEQRLVLNATGPDTVRLLPPLNVSDSEIDEAISRIRQVV
jgi:acetylornithine/N-succinyldiaminopimelate aminotransferase